MLTGFGLPAQRTAPPPPVTSRQWLIDMPVADQANGWETGRRMVAGTSYANSYVAYVYGRQLFTSTLIRGQQQQIDVSVTSGIRLQRTVHSPNECGGYFVWGDGQLLK